MCTNEHKLMAGWKINKKPDRYDEILAENFASLDELAYDCEEALGYSFESIYGRDLVVKTDLISLYEEEYVIGIPLEQSEPLPIDEFMQKVEVLEDLANLVWHAVMLCNPPSEPNLISFVKARCEL